MELNTMYYNYYNVAGRYTPATPELPNWKKRYTVKEDRVESTNYSQDCDDYKAHVTLEETYYAASVSNRAKYKTVQELNDALEQKYSSTGAYRKYSREERSAMRRNELNMTLYGTLSSYDHDDPNLSGPIKVESDEAVSTYNREMVNTQLDNIFTNAGIDTTKLKSLQLIFSIDPYDYTLTVTGTDDTDLKQTLEKLLNENNNSRELFRHILYSEKSSLSEDALLKYSTMRSFIQVTDEDPRDYKVTKDGLVNEEGENILDVFREALKTSDAVPAEYKGDAYSHFTERIEKLLAKDYDNIPDLTLTVGYTNGSLQDLSNADVMRSSFDTRA